MAKVNGKCPVLGMLHVMGKRWTIPIVETLYTSKDEMSFNALQAALGGITPKNLNDSLKELSKSGFVQKYETMVKGVKHTGYHLTERGQAFEDIIRESKSDCAKLNGIPASCGSHQCSDCKLFN